MEEPKNLDELIQLFAFARGCFRMNHLDGIPVEVDCLLTQVFTQELHNIPTEKLVELIIHNDNCIRAATKQVLDSRL